MKFTINSLLIFAIALLIGGSLCAQPNIVPAPAQSGSIQITGADIHIGNGDFIENGAINFEEGKITYVGEMGNAPKADKTIDASGKQLFPGFIAPNTNLGLVEFSAVKATVDYAEIGENNAHVRSIVAYNADSKVINTLRSNGILLAQITPQNGLVSGQSSVVQLDAWNWEDAVVRTDDGIHIRWPGPVRGWGRMQQDEGKRKQSDQEKINELVAILKEARAYGKITDKKRITNARLAAFEGVWEGDKNLYIHVNEAKDIQKAVLIFTELGLKPIIVGGRDAHLVADLLKKHEIPVIIRQSHSLPSREQEDVYLPYKQSSLLHQAGILAAYGMDGFWEQRNLPFMAGTAVAYGLPYEQGVASISLNAAKILGVDQTLGSLEVGKEATLFISDGDALDMRGNQVIQAFISGREIDLDNYHKQLFQRYDKKYGEME